MGVRRLLPEALDALVEQALSDRTETIKIRKNFFI